MPTIRGTRPRRNPALKSRKKYRKNLLGTLIGGKAYTFKRLTTNSQINATGGTKATSGFNTAVSTSPTVAGIVTLTTPFFTYNTGTGAAAGSTHYGSVGMKFCLADHPSFAEFTSLFDYWKLVKVNVKLIPLQIGALTVASGVGGDADGYNLCVIHSCLDYDDADAFTASETGLLEMLERPDVKSRSVSSNAMGRPALNRTLRPKVLRTVFNSNAAVTGKEIANKSVWLDCAQPSIEHFGLKFMLECHNGATTLNYAYQFRMIATYHFQFRGVR